MRAFSVVYYRKGRVVRVEETFPSEIDARVYSDMLNRRVGLPPVLERYAVIRSAGLA